MFTVKYSDPEPEDTGTPGVCGWTGTTVVLNLPSNQETGEDVSTDGVSANATTTETETY